MMLCQSVRPGYDFAGHDLNFSGQLSNDRLLFAALWIDYKNSTACDYHYRLVYVCVNLYPALYTVRYR